MELNSNAFKLRGMTPKMYSCQGKGINPDLAVSDVPRGAKSLVLIVEDPDAPSKTFNHWVAYDIPADKQVIKVGETFGTQGINDFGRLGYSGPCPQPSHTNRYFFKLYALNDYLNLPQGLGKHEVQSAMRGRVLETAELIGLYAKS